MVKFTGYTKNGDRFSEKHQFQATNPYFLYIPANFCKRIDSMMGIDSHEGFDYPGESILLGNRFFEGKESIPCYLTKIPKKNRFPTLGSRN